jgi:hypothetical protein
MVAIAAVVASKGKKFRYYTKQVNSLSAAIERKRLRIHFATF